MSTIDVVGGDIPDLLISALEDIQKGEWFQELADLQDYPMTRLAREGGVAKERTGTQLSFRIADDAGDDDGHHGMYEDFDVDRGAHLVKGNVGWRHIRHGFAIDSREVAMNSGSAQIIDDMAVMRAAMWQRICNDWENTSWGVPASSDLLAEHGIPYWVPWISTASGDFQGTIPSGHTTVGGISPTDHPKYRCYTDKYTTATRNDLGVKLMKAIRKINFRPPHGVKAENQGRFSIYCGNTVLQDLETIAAESNDQVGFDLAAAMDVTTLKRTQLTWVPMLDENAAASSDPVYIINHNYLYPAFLKGYKFIELPPERLPKQRLAVGVEAYATGNWCCSVRRRQAVIAKAAPFGEA